MTVLDRSSHPAGTAKARNVPADLIPAAAILNELAARPVPERPPSAHAAQLVEFIGVLPEAALQKASK